MFEDKYNVRVKLIKAKSQVRYEPNQKKLLKCVTEISNTL